MVSTIPRHCLNSNGVSSFRFILIRQSYYSTSATTTTTTTTRGSLSSSTSEEPNSLSSLTNWLVGSLGFSQEQALSTSTKLTHQRQSKGAKVVCNPDLLRNAESVVSFFQNKGLEIPQIRNTVYSVPIILACKIGRNLEPKMEFFQELGFSAFDFARVISTLPVILAARLDSTIRPDVDDLRAVMGSDENVVSAIKALRLNGLLLVTKHLVFNVSALRAQGIPIESIRKRVLHNPVAFMRKSEDFKEIIAGAETKWGVRPSSTGFLSALEVISSLNEKTIEAKCRVFESFGWDLADVEDLFRRKPVCFTLSEGNIRDKLDFLMNEWGSYDPGYIIACPVMLTFSLEKRLVPRYLVFQLLKEKGLIRGDQPPQSMVKMNESGFLARFIRPFEDQIPDLLHLYTKSISSST